MLSLSIHSAKGPSNGLHLSTYSRRQFLWYSILEDCLQHTQCWSNSVSWAAGKKLVLSSDFTTLFSDCREVVGENQWQRLDIWDSLLSPSGSLWVGHVVSVKINLNPLTQWQTLAVFLVSLRALIPYHLSGSFTQLYKILDPVPNWLLTIVSSSLLSFFQCKYCPITPFLFNHISLPLSGVPCLSLFCIRALLDQPT